MFSVRELLGARLKPLLLLSIVLMHTSLIFIRGYFLSIEFTLYPFLKTHGFLPYKDIIDQHFPTLLFGPFSLSPLLTTNPWPLLALFVLVLCLTDIILYSVLVKRGVKMAFVWTTFYVLSSVYFSGNVLWLETFVNLLLATLFFLSLSDRPITKFVCGLIFSQIILMRPTIIPATLLTYFGLSLPFNFLLLSGIFVGISIPIIYMYHFDLLDSFYQIALVFNGQVYAQAAKLLPAKRQVLLLFLWLAPVLYSLIKSKKYLLMIALTSYLALVIPRFGFEHLQPLFLSGTVFWAISTKKPNLAIYVFIVLLFILNLVSSVRHPYGNYFLTPQVKNAASFVKLLPGNTVYLLGASDLIYPLSGKYPPNFTYLPSLPWYFGQKEFAERVINSLSGRYTPVLIDYSATVDGRNIVESSGTIIEYIRMNYTEGEKIENYTIYYPKI